MELAGYITVEEKKSLTHKQYTIAAHIDDNITDEQMKDILRYIKLIQLENKTFQKNNNATPN